MRKPHEKSHSRIMAIALFLILGALFIGCGQSPSHTVDSAQKTFLTPEDAARSLQDAARNHDDGALTSILGPHAKALVRSVDPVEDKASLDFFVVKYDRMHRWAKMSDGSELLYIGADNYPFLVPIAEDSNSQWHFDAVAARNELLSRRIGRNELLAIDACYALANAEEIYSMTAHDGTAAHQYTTTILSTPGKQDGLFWKVAADAPPSPLGRVDEFAKGAVDAASSAEPTVFDGYQFRILTSQGNDAKGGAKSYLSGGRLVKGFAVVAEPVKYGDSGIMTFVMNREGAIYQRDLGTNTRDGVGSIDSYNPGKDWERVE